MGCQWPLSPAVFVYLDLMGVMLDRFGHTSTTAADLLLLLRQGRRQRRERRMLVYGRRRPWWGGWRGEGIHPWLVDYLIRRLLAPLGGWTDVDVMCCVCMYDTYVCGVRSVSRD